MRFLRRIFSKPDPSVDYYLRVQDLWMESMGELESIDSEQGSRDESRPARAHRAAEIVERVAADIAATEPPPELAAAHAQLVSEITAWTEAYADGMRRLAETGEEPPGVKPRVDQLGRRVAAALPAWDDEVRAVVDPGADR
jgi:hypothetical protein